MGSLGFPFSPGSDSICAPLPPRSLCRKEASLPSSRTRAGLGGGLGGRRGQGKQAPLPPQPLSPGCEAACLCTALFVGLMEDTADDIQSHSLNLRIKPKTLSQLLSTFNYTNLILIIRFKLLALPSALRVHRATLGRGRDSGHLRCHLP